MKDYSNVELLDFDDTDEFSSEVLAEKQVKLVLTDPSGDDLTFSYKNGDGKSVTEPQHLMLLSDQSSRWKKAKAKLHNASSKRNEKYDEDVNIKRTANLIASVIMSLVIVAKKNLIALDNSDGTKQYEIRDVLIANPEIREQATEILNDRSEFLGNSKTS